MLTRYQIRREVGRGAMGVVYEAWDAEAGRTVALKTVQLPLAGSDVERAQLEAQFLGEAQIAARLSHPHIVQVLDSGRDPDTGTLFIAFEYVDGAPLSDIVTPGTPIPWPQALRIVERVAGALDHAHAQGVLHRDIKPSNVMLMPDGEPKVLDFGIASLSETAGALSAPGRHVGTPLYLSPEQALGRPLDVRSDVFQLGAVLYFLLTGRAPFVAGTIRTILMRVVQEDPLPPSRFAVGLPGDADDIVRRAMAKNPIERYEGPRPLAEDIEDVLAGRPARHLARWAPPAAAQTNPFSPVDPEDAIHELEDELHSGPLPGRSSTDADLAALAAGQRLGIWRAYGRLSRVAVVLGVAAIAGAAVGLAPGRVVSRPDLPVEAAATPSSPAAPVAEPTPEAVVPVATASAGVAEAPVVAPPPAAERLGRPPLSASLGARVPPPRAVPVVPAATPPPVALPPSTATPARLALDFEHGLKSGRIRVWIDGALELDQSLESETRRKAVAFKSRKGALSEMFEVAPGAHTLKLEVRWEDNVRTETTEVTFLPGESRRLAARLGGLLKKGLSMQWRYTDARASQ
jgi:hypothetical protein